MEKNKVTFGLQDVHWAEVTREGDDGALTYGTVERLRGAAELTLSHKGILVPIKQTTSIFIRQNLMMAMKEL